MGTVYKTHQQLEDEDTERYLKKQADIFERRKARREAEGYKCTVEGCGQAFKEMLELRSHIYDHQQEDKMRMKCNQAKCGLKFNNRRDYNEHVEMHRAEAQVKILSNIRSVLLYNKHGLLVEEFEREFRSMIGKHVPYKLVGYNSAYDLVSNIPDVVQVTHLDGGQTLLLAMPDEKTEHISKMVGNQRSNREGFNYRTGEVLANVGRNTLRKIEKAAEAKNRKVPEFMKKQVEQLNAIGVFEGGLDLLEFQEVYDQEFGYPLDFRCYGFYSLEDFVFHGLQGVVELEVESFRWKIVPRGNIRCAEAPEVKEIPISVKSNFKKLLDENQFGVSVPTLVRTYEGSFGQLNVRELQCKDLAELCYLMPDICCVDKSDAGDLTIFPAGHLIEKEKTNGRTSPALWVLGEVKSNIWKLLNSLPNGVTLTTFVKGYEGYYGYLNLGSLQCKDMLELCGLMPDVCSLKLAENGQYMICPAKKPGYEDKVHNDSRGAQVLESSVPESCKWNVKRVLVKNPGGVKLSEFHHKYLEAVGRNMDASKLGFTSMKYLLNSLNGSLLQFDASESDPILNLSMETESKLSLGPDMVSPLLSERIIRAGWVNVLKVVSPELIYVRMDGMEDKVVKLEEKMEQFYTLEMAGQKIVPEKLIVGLEVAAVDRDTAWHRGRVVSIEAEREAVVIFYVDHGWSALVKMDTLMCLDSQFYKLAEQAVPVKLSGLKRLADMKYWSSGIVREFKEIVNRAKGRGWMQMREGDNSVDLFMKLVSINGNKWGPGKMALINQALVEKGLAVAKTGHSPGVLDKSLLWEGIPVVMKSGKLDSSLQRLVLASLTRIRVEERHQVSV
eukprot:GFUD01044154.1.p1 GENE.GFUD01044154.1~~GFUD01044154.1.p1  ORF type:complete len:856 (+),score=209.24 GFUD01044154.1:57-2570(+)